MSGFKVSYKSYFNSILFPFIFIARMASRLMPIKVGKKGIASDFEGVNSNRLFDVVLFQVFRLELFFIRIGIRFPFGVSAVIIAKKSE
jgi:hypothetical protein